MSDVPQDRNANLLPYQRYALVKAAEAYHAAARTWLRIANQTALSVKQRENSGGKTVR